MLPEKEVCFLFTCFYESYRFTATQYGRAFLLNGKKPLIYSDFFRQQELEVVTMPLLRILIDRKGKDYLHPMLPIPICRSRLKKALSEL